jgi:CheY-like chemotaxis protein
VTPTARLLVVDDDEASRYIVRGLAESLGFGFEEADGGALGLSLVGRQAPAAVVLDLVMPDLDGAAVLQRLRAEAATRALPVVIATSKLLTPRERAEFEALGAVVLAKSEFAAPEAAARLRAALTQAGMAP